MIQPLKWDKVLPGKYLDRNQQCAKIYPDSLSVESTVSSFSKIKY